MRWLLVLFLLSSNAFASDGIQCIFEKDNQRYSLQSYARSKNNISICSRDEEHVSCFSPPINIETKNGLILRNTSNSEYTISVRSRVNEVPLSLSITSTIFIPKGEGIETVLSVDNETYSGYCKGSFVKYHIYF